MISESKLAHLEAQRRLDHPTVGPELVPMQLADRTWKPCAEGPVSSWTTLYQRPGVCIKRSANNDRFSECDERYKNHR